MTKRPQYFYDTLYIGPRRDAVGKVEREMQVAEANMDLALDTRDEQEWRRARRDYVQARTERDRLLTCHIHEIEGATEFFQRQDAERKLDNVTE